jgi:hypothetical protein
MYDLFGEIPVSIRDVELWLDRVVNFRGSNARVAYYVLNWDVVAKIRSAKVRGTWDERIEPEYNHELFSFHARRIALRIAYQPRPREDDNCAAPERSRAEDMARLVADRSVFSRGNGGHRRDDARRSLALSQH